MKYRAASGAIVLILTKAEFDLVLSAVGVMANVQREDKAWGRLRRRLRSKPASLDAPRQPGA